MNDKRRLIFEIESEIRSMVSLNLRFQQIIDYYGLDEESNDCFRNMIYDNVRYILYLEMWLKFLKAN